MPGGVGLLPLDWIGLKPWPPGWRPGPDAESLDPGTVARLVPGLASPTAGFLVRGQARVNPLVAVAQLAATLDAVVTGTNVTAVETRSDRLVAVTTTSGAIVPGAVIFATGEPPTARGLELALPTRRVRGHLLTTAPAPLRLPGSVAPVATTLPDGRLLAGGTKDVETSDEVDPSIVAGIRAQLDAYLPGVVTVETTHAWRCFRPAHPDGLPVIDRVPGLRNAWFTSGHYTTGIVMAAGTATALASWIDTDRPPDSVSALTADRLH